MYRQFLATFWFSCSFVNNNEALKDVNHKHVSVLLSAGIELSVRVFVVCVFHCMNDVFSPVIFCRSCFLLVNGFYVSLKAVVFSDQIVC